MNAPRPLPLLALLAGVGFALTRTPLDGQVELCRTAWIVGNQVPIEPCTILGIDCSGATTVSVTDDTVVIGSRQYNGVGGIDSGAIFVSARESDGWSTPVRLEPAGSTEFDEFGASVSIHGDVIAVGSPFSDLFGLASGHVTIFRRSGADWIEEQTVVVSGSVAFDRFGIAVAVEGDTLVVGADGVDDQADHGGAAYVFQFDGTEWMEVQELQHSEPLADGFFGANVAIEGDIIAVGAYEPTSVITDNGSVDIFRLSAGVWVHEQYLAPSVFFPYAAHFGRSVDLNQGRLAVGAPFDDDRGQGAGAVYIYEYDGASWTLEQKLAPGLLDSFDWFGHSVALNGDHLIVGAPNDEILGSLTGTAYYFQFDGTSWGSDTVIDDPAFFGALPNIGYQVAAASDFVAVSGFPFVAAPGGGIHHDSAFLYNTDFTDCNLNGLPDVCDLETGTSVDLDGDGVPDECSLSEGFRRGRCNADAALDISDAIFLLTHLFAEPQILLCEKACDANDDGGLDVADAIAILGTLFLVSADPLPPPTDVCGPDPTPDVLDCEATCL